MSNILKPEPQAPGQAEQINSKVKLPRSVYVVRCKKSEFAFSRKNNNPMFVLTWELCKPDTITVAGRKYAIAGVELSKQYLTLTPEAAPRLFELQRILGMPEGVDLDNPMESAGNAFIGKVANAICESEDYVLRADLTDEDIAAGKTPDQAEPLRYEDGSEMKGYRRVLVRIAEASSASVPPLATGSL